MTAKIALCGNIVGPRTIFSLRSTLHCNLERESSGIGKNRLELIRLIRAELFARNSYAANGDEGMAKLGTRIKLRR